MTHLVARQQSGGDQLPEDILGRLAVREDRQQLLPVARCPRPVRGHEVAEHLPHHPLTIGPDPLERRLRVARESAGHAADLRVGLLGEEPSLPVPLLPQARHGEGEQRQRPALPLDRVRHLADQSRLEAESLRSRRLLERAAQRLPRERAEWRQLREDRRERLVLVAPHEEVVPHREEHVHSGLAGEPAQQLGETRLRLRRAEREQLLELVHHEESLRVGLAPPHERLERLARVLESHEPPQRLDVALQLGREGLPQHQQRRVPGRRHHRRPARGPRRHHPRPHEGRLARPRGPDHREEPPGPDALPERLDLALSPEEPVGVRLGERAQAGVRARPLAVVSDERRRRGPLQHRLEREGQVVRRVEALLRLLRQAATHDPLHRPRQRSRGSPHRRRVLVQDRRDRLRRRRPREGPPSRQRLVENRPEREEIRPRVRLSPSRLLRREVRRRPHHDTRHGRVRPAPAAAPVSPRELRQAEVQDLHEPVRRQEQVLRLEVPVQDPPRVRGLQPTARLHGRLHRGVQRQRPRPQTLVQRLSFQQLEYDVGPAVAGPHVEHREHVRVAQPRHRPRLVLEPLQALRARLALRQDHLQRDVAPQPGVVRPVHLPHAPGP